MMVIVVLFSTSPSYFKSDSFCAFPYSSPPHQPLKNENHLTTIMPSSKNTTGRLTGAEYRKSQANKVEQAGTVQNPKCELCDRRDKVCKRDTKGKCGHCILVGQACSLDDRTKKPGKKRGLQDEIVPEPKKAKMNPAPPKAKAKKREDEKKKKRELEMRKKREDEKKKRTIGSVRQPRSESDSEYYTSSSEESEKESEKSESEISSDLDENSQDEKTDCESEDEASGNEKIGNMKAANETVAGRKVETDEGEDEGGVEIEVPEIRTLDVGGKRPPSVAVVSEKSGENENEDRDETLVKLNEKINKLNSENVNLNKKLKALEKMLKDMDSQHMDESKLNIDRDKTVSRLGDMFDLVLSEVKRLQKIVEEKK